MKALVEMEGSGLVPLLTDSAYEDLGRMYSLFKRVDGGLALLRSVLGSHIKDQGRVLVNDPEKVMTQPVQMPPAACCCAQAACLVGQGLLTVARGRA